MTCDHCTSSILDGEMRCANCGAPITTDSRALPDFRTCPTCHRKLLALGSPACNYCGRRLPDEYIRAREADLKRITEVAEKQNPTGLAGEISQFFSDTRRRNRRESFSALGSVDSRA